MKLTSLVLLVASTSAITITTNYPVGEEFCTIIDPKTDKTD